MSRQYWVAPVGPFHTAAAAAYASSTTLTDVSPLPAVTLPGFTLEPGVEFEIEAEGQFSNTGTPTLLLGLYYGGVAGVALAASSAITTTTGATAWPWQLRWRGTVWAAGTAGSVNGQGRLYLGTSLVAVTTRFIPETLAARTVAIDTTVAKTVTVGAQWGTSNASNTLTCTNITVQLLS